MGCYNMRQRKAWLFQRGWHRIGTDRGDRFCRDDGVPYTLQDAYRLDGGPPPKGRAYRRPRRIRVALLEIGAILGVLGLAFFRVKRAQAARREAARRDAADPGAPAGSVDLVERPPDA